MTFEPDWQHQGPVNVGQGRIEIRSTPPAGISFDPVTRTTVIDESRGIVLEQHLYSAQGQRLATAKLSKHQRDPETGVILPRHVEISCPQTQFELQIDLVDMQINRLPANSQQLFTRPAYPGYQEVDLGNASAPVATQPAGQGMPVGGGPSASPNGVGGIAPPNIAPGTPPYSAIPTYPGGNPATSVGGPLSGRQPRLSRGPRSDRKHGLSTTIDAAGRNSIGLQAHAQLFADADFRQCARFGARNSFDAVAEWGELSAGTAACRGKFAGLRMLAPGELWLLAEQRATVADEDLPGDHARTGEQADDRGGDVVGLGDLAQRRMLLGGALHGFVRFAIALLQPATGDEAGRDRVDTNLGGQARARARVRLLTPALDAA